MSVTMQALICRCAPPRAAAPGAALGRLTRTELRLFLRERIGPVLGRGVPAGAAGHLRQHPLLQPERGSLGGLTVLDVYVPILIAFALAMLSLNALPTVLAGYRERGVLRRLQTTPAGPVRVLAAQLVDQRRRGRGHAGR